MYHSQSDIRAARRRLTSIGQFTPKSTDFEATLADRSEALVHPDGREDFKIRPISLEWRYLGRRPAYRTAVCNVAYIWRDPSACDRFGPMPESFGQRRYELRAAGMMLPSSAPAWASEKYTIWQEADAASEASGDPTELSGWHVVFSIPTAVDERWWEWLVKSFVQRQLVDRGAAVAWAIHALKGEDGAWIIHPHVHLIVSARYYRHDRRAGRRHPVWLSGWRAHLRLERAWQARAGLAKVTGRKRTGPHVGSEVPWEIA